MGKGRKPGADPPAQNHGGKHQKPMNIKDYIRWRGDISMKQDPFNEVDNLVLTQLSYINWDGIVPETGSITLRPCSPRSTASVETCRPGKAFPPAGILTPD
jgi:hypothetical protein